MLQASQSLSTLKEILLEATRFVRSQTLAKRLAELERLIDEGSDISAGVEQEIVSVRVLAELEGTVPPSSRS